MITRGFTLIELLVVVAIIGMLSSVVLGALNSTRAKTADTAVMANLRTIRSQAEIIYDSAPIYTSYTTLCVNPIVVKALTAAANTQGISTAGWTGTSIVNTTNAMCTGLDNVWVVAITLPRGAGAGKYWCADQTGVAKLVTGTFTTALVSCP